MPPRTKTSDASVGRILKYTGLFGGVQGFYALMAMVRNKITALLLKTGGMGQIDNFGRTADLIASGTNMGLAFSAVPHIARLERTRNATAIRHYVKLVRSWVFLTALLGFAVTALAAPLWSRLLWGDGSHTFDFVLLAPMVFFTTLCGGEAAVLKGLRRLRKIATVSALGAVTTLVATTTCYGVWGTRGIVPALVLSATALCAMHWRAASRSIRYEIAPMNWRFLRRGRRMIRLGLAYAAAGFVAAGGEYLVRLILLHCDGPGIHKGNDAVGLYAAAFTLTVTYARLIFMSMDADYFPRLSATVGDTAQQNLTVNRQIDVLVQLTAPLLPLFCLLAPAAVHILYSREFSGAVLMIGAAAPYLLFKAICTPVAYLGLAHSRSRLYLLVESSYSVAFVAAMALCYPLLGMPGAGLALTLCHILYLGVTLLTYSHYFHFALAADTRKRCAVQLLILLGGVAAVQTEHFYLHWGGGLFATFLSLAYSWHFLAKNTGITQRFRRWITRK